MSTLEGQVVTLVSPGLRLGSEPTHYSADVQSWGPSASLGSSVDKTPFRSPPVPQASHFSKLLLDG